MAVYVDTLQNHAATARARGLRHSHWCHLVADSEAQLHHFAATLGLKRSWYQRKGPNDHRWHYDITPPVRARAIERGAVPIDRQRLVTLMDARRWRLSQARHAHTDLAPATGIPLQRPRPLLVPSAVRGITVRQPWARCVFLGKDIENRPRPWPPGWYLIHAGQALDRAALTDPLVITTLGDRHLETGVVLGVARIDSTHADDGLCSPWAQPGRHHLVLKDATPLPLPVPAKGALHPWRPQPEVLHQVLQQIPHLVTPEATS